MRLELPVATVRTSVSVPLRFADGYATTCRAVTFTGLVDGREHLALGLGDRATDGEVADGPPLVRPHSECLTGDVFGSARCDCGPQLREAVERIASAGGWVLYLRQEGRGIGLYAKLDAYQLQDQGLDTYEANLALGRDEDERDYTVAAQMLHALGVQQVRLLSNNPDKAASLERMGIGVAERLPTAVHVSADNVRYLLAKARRGSHTLDVPHLARPAGPDDVQPVEVQQLDRQQVDGQQVDVQPVLVSQPRRPERGHRVLGGRDPSGT